MCFARRMQDIESDTGYDTRRRWPDGALARLSHTAVCDTCGRARRHEAGLNRGRSGGRDTDFHRVPFLTVVDPMRS